MLIHHQTINKTIYNINGRVGQVSEVNMVQGGVPREDAINARFANIGDERTPFVMPKGPRSAYDTFRGHMIYISRRRR